jgi:hypothetical protein
MKSYAPVLTLVVVAALAAVLFVANSLSAPAAQTVAAPAPAASSVPAEPAVPPPPPPPPPTPPPAVVVEKVFAGRSSGNEVTVAVAVKDGRAVAYVCDGKKIEAWLEGTLTGDSLSLSGKTSSITATLDDKASFGTVTVDGKEWPFSAKGVASPAGLYEGRGNVDGVAARVGWIVQEDGSVTGVENAGGSPKPAAALDPTNLGATMSDGSPVTVTALDGASTVVQR